MSTPSINNSSATQTLPIVALVLDIDGVFNTKDNPTTIYEKVKSLQEKNLSEEARKTEEISYQFDMDAIKNLMHIINTLTNEKIARVIIVISSSWRKKRSLEVLKNDIYFGQEFCPYIIDKIPDKVVIKEENSKKIKQIIDSKPQLIKYWLQENQQKQNIELEIVLDDLRTKDIRDSKGMEELFKHKFIKINWEERLTMNDAKKVIKTVKDHLQEVKR